jgi:hypothetical protein
MYRFVLNRRNKIVALSSIRVFERNDILLIRVFREDEQRKRTRHAAENFAVIRKIALNLLKKDTGKESLRSKRLKAAWDRNFLLQLLKI